MISQTKQLKNALKAVSVLDRTGNTPSCRCSKNKYGEYGYAIAHSVSMTDSQIQELKNLLPYVKIYNNQELDFAVIRN